MSLVRFIWDAWTGKVVLYAWAWRDNEGVMNIERPLRRVLHVTPSFYPAHSYGGPIVALYELCRAQQAAGWQVRVLTSDAAGDTAHCAPKATQRLSGHGGRWTSDYGVPTFYGRVAWHKDIAPELLLKLPPSVHWADIVHVTGVFSATSLLGLAGAVSLRRPCVVSPRGSLLPWALSQNSQRKRLALRLLAPLLSRVSAWHVTSEEEAAALERLRNCALVHAQAAIHIIGNGVTLSSAAPPAAEPLEKARSRPRIVILGRLHPVKNLELALLALAELRRSAPQATLLIIGQETATENGANAQGSYVRRLAQQATKLGLSVDLHSDARLLSSAAVRFLGMHTGAAKQQLLAGADVLWLCSHMESFGNVVLEALAAGTPVVAASTTPWRLLQETALGRWVAPTAADFAQATRSLLDELRLPAPRAAFMQRSQQTLKTRFSWPHVENAMRALYQSCRPE